MAGFIGNKPGAKYATLTRQTFSSPTGTSHTLSQTVTNSDDLLLYINNVKQNPADYTASGTTLTTASLAGGTEMYCLYYGKTTETVAVPSDSVDGSHIVDDAIDSEHYATGSIDEAHLADNAVTLAKMAGGTDGQIITYDASGDPVAVGPGTDGQVLTSTGAGSPPAFESVSSTTPPEACNFLTNANHVYNITGQGGSYTCAYDTEISDVGTNYNNSTYTFTATATGMYLFSVTVMIHGLEATTVDDINIQLITSNRNYNYQFGGTNHTLSEFVGGGTWFADMDASDTAYVNLIVTGQSAVNADFKNGSYFSGCRVS